MTIFATVVESLLEGGCGVRFRASGRSMQPTIQDGEMVTLAPVGTCQPRQGDIVLSSLGGRLIAHRFVGFEAAADGRMNVLLRGDASSSCDAPVDPGSILATVVAVERDGRSVALDSFRAHTAYLWRRHVADVRRVVARFWRLTITSHGIRASLSHKATNSPNGPSPAGRGSSPK
jgi:hypothetical protein